MPRIRVFNGGLRKAIAPHLINENESVVNQNINHVNGILTPVKDKVQSIPNAEKYGHYFTTDDEWYFSPTPKDWVEFQERLYIGNRTGTSTKIVNGIEYNLGIQPPTTVPTVVVSRETPEQDQITRVDLFPNTAVAGDIPAGITLQYKVVNIASTGEHYPSDEIFSVKVTSVYSPGDPQYLTNDIRIGVEDTNVDTTIAIFRFFDNYWRKVYEGVAGAAIHYDQTYDISANDSIEDYLVDGLKGTYQYALTFYNSIDGTESAPVVSDEYEIDWGRATVNNLQVSTDPQVNSRRLYRVGGTLTTFTLVTELDNIVTSYVDDADDDDIDGRLLDAETNFPPVDNLYWLMESYAMLFAADGDKLRFTPIGEPDYWPQTFFLDFPRPITGLAKTPIGLLVFNEYETWLVTGTGPTSLTQQLLTGSQGCINGDSVVNIEGAAYWASTDGVCLSDGGQVMVITREKLDKIDLSSSVNAVVYDEQYYLQLDTEALIIDIPRQVIKNANYDIESFIIANDTLYGYKESYLHIIEADTVDLSMDYRSPIYVGPAYSIPKTYKNFYMFSEGTVTIEIFIDGVLAQTATYVGYDNHQVKIPTEHTRGFSLQFRITGTGIVYEIYWEEGNANQ